MSTTHAPLVPVVLSGGAGTRLWPLSRELYPKQLLALTGERTMLQETLLRLHGLDGLAAPLIVCNEAHRFQVAEQMREIDIVPAGILLEPVGRNTAPAVAVAALAATTSGADPFLLVLPADHVIRDVSALHAATMCAVRLAEDGHLVTYGVQPTHAETGYGYIRAGASLVAGDGAFVVERFVEKPDAGTAEAYLRDGNYFWNSGMFVFRASVYLKELGRLQPAMLDACRAAWEAAAEDLDFQRLERASFSACPGDSIDYAVMEHTRAAAVVPLDAGWSDVGNFSALRAALPVDASGNVCVGDVVALDTSDSYLHADQRLLAAVGVDGYVVIETADAVLVAPKDRVQDVKQVVAALRDAGRDEIASHRAAYRPWGWVVRMERGAGYQVNRLSVVGGGSLSLQRHAHRAEHWVVVRGIAEITRGEETYRLEANESTFIPAGTRHRIHNPGSDELVIVEIQTGERLAEDDIVRYEDNYGRARETKQ